MNTLIIGGTRFVGYLLTWKLLAAGHRVTLFNRGTMPDPFGDRVTRLRGDRTTADFANLLRGKTFDAVIDFAAYNAADTQSAIDTLSGRIGHYIFVSTGQVYLVRTSAPRPADESDYAGPVMPEPPENSPDRNEWLYGIHKRAAEDALAQAFNSNGFPYTALRIPMVNGERDHYRRIEGYLWRMLDGGPILVPNPNGICRHVYGNDVNALILQILGSKNTHGQAYNLAQDEQPTLMELLQLIANLLGSRTTLLPIPTETLAQQNLKPTDISPFSGTWMSHLNPGKAKTELNFQHQPLPIYLDKIVTTFLAHPPSDRPKNYTHRPIELKLASQ